MNKILFQGVPEGFVRVTCPTCGCIMDVDHEEIRLEKGGYYIMSNLWVTCSCSENIPVAYTSIPQDIVAKVYAKGKN